MTFEAYFASFQLKFDLDFEYFIWMLGFYIKCVNFCTIYPYYCILNKFRISNPIDEIQFSCFKNFSVLHDFDILQTIESGASLYECIWK